MVLPSSSSTSLVPLSCTNSLTPLFVQAAPVSPCLSHVCGRAVCFRGSFVPFMMPSLVLPFSSTTVVSITPPPPPPPAPASASTMVDVKTTGETMNSFKLPESLPVPQSLPTLGHSMTFVPKNGFRRLATSFRLLRQIRGRLAKNTVLTARLSGDLSEQAGPSLPFSPTPMTFQMLLDALRLAAYDPRISHVHLRIDPLSCGWGKIIELRRHLEFFAKSGKTVSAFMESGGPKEYFIAMGFALYVPPDGSLSLRGFTASGAFVRGVLDKIGISPQVERIGSYKSAGDQLARKDMAPEQRETLTAILEDVHSFWTQSVCHVAQISSEDLAQFLDRSPWNMEEYVKAGLISGTCYETDLIDALKRRFSNRSTFGSGAEDSKLVEEVLRNKLQSVDVVRYTRRTNPRLLGINGRKKLAVIRALGAITPGKSRTSATGNSVGSDTLVELIRRARFDKQTEGVLLRIDSPGGAALASDIVWNELRELRKVKPVVASQGDLAASGGYYLSMACEVVSEPLTLTGSVGVVTAKPSLQDLYERIGYNKENISLGGRFAELLVEDRPFTEEESKYFREGAELAYGNFVRKAAMSRGKTQDEMEAVAQGRVWTGKQAHERGLVDHIGGSSRALEVLKDLCGVKDEFVRVEEMRAPISFAERFGLGASVSNDVVASNTAALLNQPLALADIDPAFGQWSPLTTLIIDVALASLLRSFSGASSRQLQVVVKRFLSSF